MLVDLVKTHLSPAGKQMGVQNVEGLNTLHHQRVHCRSGQVGGRADRVVNVGKGSENLAWEELVE